MRIPRTARAFLFACTVTLAGLCFGISRSADAPQPLCVSTSGSPITVIGRPQNLAVGDVNNDGKPDLVIACADKQVAVLLGDGKGGFRPAPGSPLKLTTSGSPNARRVAPGEMALG